MLADLRDSGAESAWAYTGGEECLRGATGEAELMAQGILPWVKEVGSEPLGAIPGIKKGPAS